MTLDDNKLILIVDDEPRNLQLLGSHLKQQGYTIGIAQNGQQALDFVNENIPAIILLDVMMPEMDGFEVCRRLKKMESIREIPVLFITALLDTENKLKGFQSGGSDYINKPIVQDEVLARIKVHLENRRLVKELSASNKVLQGLNQLKNKFLGMAAHDLRNPLGSIMGFTDLIIEGDYGAVSDEQIPVLKRIYSTSQRMLNLINDLLDISVIESGKLTINLSNGSLKDLINEQVMSMKLQADKKNIRLETLYHTAEKSEFDEEKIIQVMDNLIGNAIKFSPKNSDIKITLSKINDQMMVEVRDSGPGISEEDQQKLFGEFQQLSNKATSGERGTGLGLAISKKIVEAHQGGIEVLSQLGAGSVFTVTIPIKSA